MHLKSVDPGSRESLYIFQSANGIADANKIQAGQTITIPE